MDPGSGCINPPLRCGIRSLTSLVMRTSLREPSPSIAGVSQRTSSRQNESLFSRSKVTGSVLPKDAAAGFAHAEFRRPWPPDLGVRCIRERTVHAAVRIKRSDLGARVCP